VHKNNNAYFYSFFEKMQKRLEYVCPFLV